MRPNVRRRVSRPILFGDTPGIQADKLPAGVTTAKDGGERALQWTALILIFEKRVECWWRRFLRAVIEHMDNWAALLRLERRRGILR